MRARVALPVLALALSAASAAGPGPGSKASGGGLPVLGTRLSEFPPGPGKAIADKACLQCHSADIPRQQRLTGKQWTAEIEKMVRWGAEVPDGGKDELIGYLSSHFGPGNDAFRPREVRPSAPGHAAPRTVRR